MQTKYKVLCTIQYKKMSLTYESLNLFALFTLMFIGTCVCVCVCVYMHAQTMLLIVN